MGLKLTVGFIWSGLVEHIMADEELESLELQFLRQNALNTQKQRRMGLPTSRRQYEIAPNFDEVLQAQGKVHRRKNTPEMPQEVLNDFPRARREKRTRPSRSVKMDAKRPRRASSASSSHSSYSTSSPSRSHSSYSTSRTSSRSPSSASSRSSSYSGSNSYTRSSASMSSHSRSPARAKQPWKDRVSNYKDKLGQPFRTSGPERRRVKQSSPSALPRSSHGGRRHVSPHAEWCDMEYERISTKSRGMGSDRHHSGGTDRRGHLSLLPPSDGLHREPETRHNRHKSPPPSSHRRVKRDQHHEDQAYLRSRQHRVLSPRQISPPPSSRSRSHRRPLSPHRRPMSPHRSPHRHPPSPHRRPPSPHWRPLSPPRERLVVSRRSPPPPSSSQRHQASSRERFDDHLRRPRTIYHSPSPHHRRRSSLSPPPHSISRSRKSDHHRSIERERERMRAREVLSREGRKHGREGGRGAGQPRQRSPEPRKRRHDKEWPDEISAHKRDRSYRSDGESQHANVERSGRGQGEGRRSSKRSSEVLSVLDSVSMSPLKPNDPQEQPLSPLQLKSSPVKPTLSEMVVSGDGDLLGDYDFNPFVDEELDYDENMDDLAEEEPVPNTMREEGEEEEEEEGAVMDDSQGDKEVVEVSPSPSSPLKVQPGMLVIPEDISSDSDEGSEKEATAIRSPIRVSPERHRSRDRNRHERRKDRQTSSATKTLSVKDRLFVSKKAILEKRRSLGQTATDSLRPSLANRLGPSPGDRHSLSRSQGANRQSKGSAVEIAKAYRMKMREEQREEEKLKARKVAKMINSQDKKLSNRRSSPIPDSLEDKVDKERALDQRIDRIKQNNRERERREIEIEKDKQLYS